LIKRIAGTENTSLSVLDDDSKVLYIYKTDGKLKKFDSENVNEMFRSHKSQCRKKIEINEIPLENSQNDPIRLQVCHLNEKPLIILNNLTNINIYFK
jgi:hypothetical protein